MNRTVVAEHLIVVIFSWILRPKPCRPLKTAYITAMIFIHIILHSAVHIYVFHIFITSSSSFHGFITNQFNYLLPLACWLSAAPVSLSVSVSCFLFATAKVAYITAMIFIDIILHSAVHIYVFHIFITSSKTVRFLHKTRTFLLPFSLHEWI